MRDLNFEVLDYLMHRAEASTVDIYADLKIDTPQSLLDSLSWLESKWMIKSSFSIDIAHTNWRINDYGKRKLNGYKDKIGIASTEKPALVDLI